MVHVIQDSHAGGDHDRDACLRSRTSSFKKEAAPCSIHLCVAAICLSPRIKILVGRDPGSKAAQEGALTQQTSGCQVWKFCISSGCAWHRQGIDQVSEQVSQSVGK